jgi:hypothetical protein
VRLVVGAAPVQQGGQLRRAKGAQRLALVNEVVEVQGEKNGSERKLKNALSLEFVGSELAPGIEGGYGGSNGGLALHRQTEPGFGGEECVQADDVSLSAERGQVRVFEAVGLAQLVLGNGSSPSSRQPKPCRILASAAPMCPTPTRPSVLPRSSKPMSLSKQKSLARSCWSARCRWRPRASMRATACSAIA